MRRGIWITVLAVVAFAAIVGLVAASAVGRAGAEPVVVRVASMAPEGTAWARDALSGTSVTSLNPSVCRNPS